MRNCPKSTLLWLIVDLYSGRTSTLIDMYYDYFVYKDYSCNIIAMDVDCIVCDHCDACPPDTLQDYTMPLNFLRDLPEKD